MCLVQDARGFEAIGETGNEEPYCTKVYAQDKYKLTGTDKLSWVDNALKETTGRTCNKVDVVDDAGAEVQARAAGLSTTPAARACRTEAILLPRHE